MTALVSHLLSSGGVILVLIVAAIWYLALTALASLLQHFLEKWASHRPSDRREEATGKAPSPSITEQLV